LILQGAGENGKSALTTDGLVPALGSYASMARSKLFQSTKGSEHSTEMADRGRRLLIAEELTEGRSIDVAALKRITDVGTIKARYIRQDNMEFKSTHSLMVTTNYIPVINETDRGVASTPATTLPVHLPQGE
jgi:putative DNA primase/helicase